MKDDRDLLKLDRPTKDHCLFQDEVQKTEIRKSLRPVLDTATKVPTKLRESFLEFMMNYAGPGDRFWIELRKKEEFRRNEKIIKDLQFTCDLGMLTLYHVPLIKELQKLREIKREDDNEHTIKRIHSSRDLALLDVNFWKKLINMKDNGKVIGIPGEFREKGSLKKREEAYLTSITESIDRTYPTAAFYRELSKDTKATNEKDNKNINWKLLRQFLRNNLSFDPTNPIYDSSINWDGIEGANERELVKASMKVLRDEVKMFPSYDYMKEFVNRNGKGLNNRVKEAILKYLDNYNFDLEDTCIDAYLIDPKSKKKKVRDYVTDKEKVRDDIIVNVKDKKEVRDNIIKELKGLQRIFRVTQDYKEIKLLKKKDFYSAFRISYTPKDCFIEQFSDIPGGIEKQKRSEPMPSPKQFSDVLGGVGDTKEIRVNAMTDE
jgi:hypothetical protein